MRKFGEAKLNVIRKGAISTASRDLTPSEIESLRKEAQEIHQYYRTKAHPSKKAVFRGGHRMA